MSLEAISNEHSQTKSQGPKNILAQIEKAVASAVGEKLQTYTDAGIYTGNVATASMSIAQLITNKLLEADEKILRLSFSTNFSFTKPIDRQDVFMIVFCPVIADYVETSPHFLDNTDKRRIVESLAKRVLHHLSRDTDLKSQLCTYLMYVDKRRNLQ